MHDRVEEGGGRARDGGVLEAASSIRSSRHQMDRITDETDITCPHLSQH